MILQATATVPRDGSIFLLMYRDHSGFTELFFDQENGLWLEADGSVYSDEAHLEAAGWLELPANLQALLRSAPSFMSNVEHRDMYLAAKRRLQSDG